MKSQSHHSILAKIFLIVLAVTHRRQCCKRRPKTKKDAAASQSKGKEFNTPKEAADSLDSSRGIIRRRGVEGNPWTRKRRYHQLGRCSRG